MEFSTKATPDDIALYELYIGAIRYQVQMFINAGGSDAVGSLLTNALIVVVGELIALAPEENRGTIIEYAQEQIVRASKGWRPAWDQGR